MKAIRPACAETIWAVMMGVITSKTQCELDNNYDIPHDPDDFGRCYRLLQLFPAWQLRLREVGELLPKWEPMVRHWKEMKRLYKEDRHQTLYNLMQRLEEQGMIRDGWIKKGEGSWERKT